MNTKALLHTALIFGSLASASALAQTAHAGTLVTCGPNGAASIVKVVPAGCRHLSATSAPKHSPDNPVEESRLGFTFKASAPAPQEAQPVAADQEAQPKVVATYQKP
ncbi:hypothetical protein [Acaryochloris marina]|uniref:Uncharacterized protein n=1 Tax=Acaryochloris marina (strain MBIC 11017) TaxID=329726 RepID=B0C854_ACAM1|nr:hypothetical protein [Acaryochloris marina]ABW27738.1 hypothetical protein AM1_2738 [Acaryochloris marina MBIC11017]BDM82468.1 hypothetical protein AM10699_53290 [Acaryochloris marina MBIC10699]